jgi:hypothetical protein
MLRLCFRCAALGIFLLSACAREPFSGLDAGTEPTTSVDHATDPNTGGNGGATSAGDGDEDSGATSCSDGDADGACDDVDNCPTQANADQRDADGDGMGDACGDPCAIEALSSSVDTGDLSVSEISLNGAGQVLEVAAGAALQLKFDFSLDACRPGAFTLSHQIMVGFDDGSAPICAFDGVCAPASGTGNERLSAPSQPGMYYLLVDVAQQMQCPGAWDGAAPDASHRIAAVCVR